jgi:hypothetical protein
VQAYGPTVHHLLRRVAKQRPILFQFLRWSAYQASDRATIEAALQAAKDGITGEAKWTKITEQDEAGYIALATKFLELVEAGYVKMRVMFTQNIHSTDHIQHYEQDARYFKLYYQFIKHRWV